MKFKNALQQLQTINWGIQKCDSSKGSTDKVIGSLAQATLFIF